MMHEAIQDETRQIHRNNPSPRLLAKWFAFDLDDTLHSFRAASSAAVKTVLKVIHDLNGRALEELESEYERVLAKGTVSAFVDGKASHEYRRDRFWQLVRACNVALEDEQVQSLVALYEEVFMESLELKPGVLELLQTLKRLGHKIAVVTERPQDAQERTVEALGIAPYIDFLASTNKLGVAKIDRLFVRVLEHLEIHPQDMVMTGDSWERDIVPATQAGIYCIFYSEAERTLEHQDKQARIGQFEELRALVEAAHC